MVSLAHVQRLHGACSPPGPCSPPRREDSSAWGSWGSPAQPGGAPLAPPSQVPTLWSRKGFRALGQDVVPPALQIPPGLHQAPRPTGQPPHPPGTPAPAPEGHGEGEAATELMSRHWPPTKG